MLQRSSQRLLQPSAIIIIMRRALHNQSACCSILHSQSLFITQYRSKHRLSKEPHFPKYNKIGSYHYPRIEFDPYHIQEVTGGEYTTEPLSINRTGGTNLKTGERVLRHLRKGVKFDYFMVDECRGGPEKGFREERILEVRRDPVYTRKVYIALVAGQQCKRWLLATNNMVAGHIIRSTMEMSNKLVSNPMPGDAYPIGALEPGMMICQIEQYPGYGVHYAVAPGASFELIRHMDDYSVFRNTDRKEYAVKKQCQCVIGKMSHEDWKEKWLGSPNMMRRFGYHHATGERMTKEGYSGRKLKAPPPVKIADRTHDEIMEDHPRRPPDPEERQSFSVTKRQNLRLVGANKDMTHHLVQQANLWRI